MIEKENSNHVETIQSLTMQQKFELLFSMTAETQGYWDDESAQKFRMEMIEIRNDITHLLDVKGELDG